MTNYSGRLSLGVEDGKEQVWLDDDLVTDRANCTLVGDDVWLAYDGTMYVARGWSELPEGECYLPDAVCEVTSPLAVRATEDSFVVMYLGTSSMTKLCDFSYGGSDFILYAKPLGLQYLYKGFGDLGTGDFALPSFSYSEKGAIYRQSSEKAYQLFYKGRQISAETEWDLCTDDHDMIYFKDERRYFFVEDAEKCEVGGFKPAQPVGQGPTIWARFNGCFFLYHEGANLSDRVTSEYRSPNAYLYDPETRAQFVLKNFESHNKDGWHGIDED